MRYLHPLEGETGGSADLLGAKACGLLTLRRLGLPVPPGFVVDTRACRAFLRDGHLPDRFDAELAAAVRHLEAATGRRFGGRELPLAVSVRSGAAVSMPGMMNTVLNLGLTTDATAGLAAETGDPAFAREARQRFLAGFAAAAGGAADDDAMSHLRATVRAVMSSWNTPRAVTYRELHGIPHDLGTAVVVQTMVFGNRDRRSGSGVAFSRDPNTGERGPYGDVLFGRQGEDVVSGESATEPLTELTHRAPAVWDDLGAALRRIEQHYSDAGHVEFTFEAGHLWLLQVRPGGLTGRAAIRVAVDLADERVIDRRTAVRRVTQRHLRHAGTPRLRAGEGVQVLARGRGAGPGVATGRIAVTAERAARMASDGPVILVRPTTSPLDMHGLAAAAGILTSRGGPTSHAAVVARAMNKPAVVGAATLTIDALARSVRIGARTLTEGTVISLDGGSGEIVLGDPGTVTATTDEHVDRLLSWADEISGDHSPRPAPQRLDDAHAHL
ncbi:pyruvate, phosphate dikinase [Actinoplanes sp. NPDC048988]|uniref:pyruvate, phosphate dikinase n=1 Tax=Actinoplanes sp. NPDC048988 TaxID=3363901 RepID=UPI0037106412